jgi:hypothetical protein
VSKHFTLGLDLGQATDYSALVVCMDISDPSTSKYKKTLHLRHLERFQLPYPEVVRRVKARMEHPLLAGRAVLAVDGTGVGRGVVDLLKAEMPNLTPNSSFYGVLIHGGDKEHLDKGYHRVPKRNLVFGAQVALEQERLKFAAGMELLPTLVEELRNFRLKIDPRTAHDSYSHWRENQHDDLVLAVSLAVWAANKAGTTSSPVVLRRESYWKGADGEQEASRPPIEGVGGWHQHGETDMALNIWRKGDWS